MSADERADFIAPNVQWFACELAAGKANVVEYEYHELANWADGTVPRKLVPFLTHLSFDHLHKALEKIPYLYWHPIVRDQILYLVRLRYDGRLWEQLRWAPLGSGRNPPEGAERATQLLQALIAVHTDSLVRGHAVHWKTNKRRGPRPGLKNPNPADERYSIVDPLLLLHDFHSLRGAIRAELDRTGLRPPLGGSISTATRKRLGRICFKGLSETDIQWSGFHQALPSEVAKRSDWQRIKQWKVPQLPHAIDTLLNQPNRRLIRDDGLPTALAYATLASLLRTTPAKVRNALDPVRSQVPKGDDPS